MLGQIACRVVSKRWVGYDPWGLYFGISYLALNLISWENGHICKYTNISHLSMCWLWSSPAMTICTTVVVTDGCLRCCEWCDSTHIDSIWNVRVHTCIHPESMCLEVSESPHLDLCYAGIHVEECLAHWCKNHTDCPLCRQQVGAPDPKDGEPWHNADCHRIWFRSNLCHKAPRLVPLIFHCKFDAPSMGCVCVCWFQTSAKVYFALKSPQSIGPILPLEHRVVNMKRN